MTFQKCLFPPIQVAIDLLSEGHKDNTFKTTLFNFYIEFDCQICFSSYWKRKCIYSYVEIIPLLFQEKTVGKNYLTFGTSVFNLKHCYYALLTISQKKLENVNHVSISLKFCTDIYQNNYVLFWSSPLWCVLSVLPLHWIM